MDRWQLWRRVWFRMNRKNHTRRRQNAVATRTRSDPEGRYSQPPPARYQLGRQDFMFITMSSLGLGITQRPKMLLDVDCSDLLMGGSEEYENFSSTCWLEDHLHRFGGPSQPAPDPSQVYSSYEFHGSTELEASSSSADLGNSFEDYSVDSAEEPNDDDVSSTSSSGWNHIPVGSSNGNVINLHRYPYVEQDTQMPEPPPYQDEPPPSYEEAIAGSSFFDHDSSDFLW